MGSNRECIHEGCELEGVMFHGDRVKCSACGWALYHPNGRQVSSVPPSTAPPAGIGTRGARTTTTDPDAVFETWRTSEHGWVKARILIAAYGHDGMFHAEQVADVQVSERSMIGAAIQGLARGGYLERTNIHRPARYAGATHGRRSYEYRLTTRGHALALRCMSRREADHAPGHHQGGLW